MGVIFDLDQTLVDSASIAHLREARDWPAAYLALRELKLYPGIAELLAWLHAGGVPLCIVTSAPRPYCERMVAAHSIPIVHTVCYHDTARRKPHPDPMLRGLERLGLPADAVCAVGDHPIDLQAARAAGMYAIAAGWGCADVDGLRATPHDWFAASVDELRAHLGERLGLA